jgi:Deoxycytidine deaminase
MTILDGSYQCGMLVDTDIKRALELLFSSNASPDKAKYSTYEIVVDKGYKKITYNEEGQLDKRHVHNPSGSIQAAPGETIVVYSYESFTIPENVYARVNTVGQIFIAGFSAENTYIDPGYSGKIGVTLINNTNRILTINEGAPLARIEFIKLNSRPEIIHIGSSGVRPSTITPSIDHELANNYLNRELLELIEEIKESITIDVLQKKSIRTDIALSRAYVFLIEQIRTLQLQNSDLSKNHKTLKFFNYVSVCFLGMILVNNTGLASIIVDLINTTKFSATWVTKLVDVIVNGMGGGLSVLLVF